MTLDPVAWKRAGGDTRRLELLGTLGQAAPFSDGTERCLASIHPAQPRVGTIADWTGSPKLLHAAEAWLRERGCQVIRGPMEMCSWFGHRANQGPFDEPAFALEPQDRPEPWEAAGYQQVAHYVSAVADSERQVANALNQAAALSATGWQVMQPSWADRVATSEPVPEEAFRELVLQLHWVGERAFDDSYGYAPIPAEALWMAYQPLRARLDPRLIFMARDPDGNLAGFLLALPDFAQPERGWFLVHALGVLPEHRHLGIGSWLVGATHRAAIRAGYREGVHPLMWTGSRDGPVSRHGGRVFRRYALFEKAI